MFKNLNLDAIGITGRQSELIELTLSFGFKGFDLDLVQFGQQVEQKGLAHARRLLDSARLKIGSFELPIDWDGDEENYQRQLGQLSEQIAPAAEIGCTRSRLTIPPANDVRPYHECFELYRRRFAEICDVLAESNMRLGIGFVAPARYRGNRAFQFIHTFDALLMLAKSVAADNVGVVLDVWHWHVSGGSLDQIEALTAADVVTVDLADAQTVGGEDDVDESTRALPGKGPAEGGLIDVPTILATLARAGYDGPVTPKPHASCFEGMRRDQIVKRLGKAMDDVWTSTGLTKSGKLVPSAPQ